VPGLRMCGANTPNFLMRFIDVNKNSYIFTLLLHYMRYPVRHFRLCSTRISIRNAIFEVIQLFRMKTHSSANLWNYKFKLFFCINTNL
jgi:hypothetical protein